VSKIEKKAEAANVSAFESGMERLIFASRWVQAPLYIGLIVAGVLYAFKFAEHLWHMTAELGHLGETQVMLGVLTLVDITMVANLLVMVIIGGYATFVSKLDLAGHPDRPDWLEHIDAGTMKVKLAGSLVGVSGIHLLQSFINMQVVTDKLQATVFTDPAMLAAATEAAIMPVKWQVIIHFVFLLSSIMLAWTEKVLASKQH
jgi:uncharacterized protein (TIGR00645 family)